MLRSLLLFAGFVVVVYVGLVRHRGWHVEHYEPHARRAHFLVCVLLALVAASATVYLLRDPIVCPPGTAYSDLVPAQTRKAGIAVECRASDGTPVKGSTFSGLFAWLDALVLVFVGTSAVWRRFGPPPPPPAPPEAPRLDPPTDRRERRRQRKREQRDRDRGVAGD